jgi:hypothetical protein
VEKERITPMAYSPLTLLAYAITAFLAYWAWHDHQYRLGRKKHPFFSRGGQRRARVSRPQVNHGDFERGVAEISRYTHNRDVAQRLLHSTRQANRGRSLDWCAEKTIEDIIRDRR